MTYQELKIALDIGDPETVLSSITEPYNNIGSAYFGDYFVVCDDGDVHCFDKNGKEHKIEYIPIDCFAFDHSLKKVDLEGIKSIGSKAFYDCQGLTNVVIPSTMVSIGDYVFDNCYNLTNVTIHGSETDTDSMISIGTLAFGDCYKLEDLTIPSNVVNIGEYAFVGCYNLKSIVFKGKTMEQVKSMAYYPWGVDDKRIIKAGL